MNISKFTQKSLEAVQNTEKLAYEYGNQQIDQEHLLYSLLTVEDSLIFKLITKMGISGDQFRDEVQQAIGEAAEGIRRSGVFLQRCQQGAGERGGRSQGDGGRVCFRRALISGDVKTAE